MLHGVYSGGRAFAQEQVGATHEHCQSSSRHCRSVCAARLLVRKFCHGPFSCGPV